MSHFGPILGFGGLFWANSEGSEAYFGPIQVGSSPLLGQSTGPVRLEAYFRYSRWLEPFSHSRGVGGTFWASSGGSEAYAGLSGKVRGLF